jgi:hypothetical protein
VTPHPTNHCSGGEDIHKFHLHRHADGEKHADGVGLPQDQGVLQGEAWTGVSGINIVNIYILFLHFQYLVQFLRQLGRAFL